MAIRVLVVDDDKDLLTLIEKFLVKEHPDFEAISTISAQDAVRKLEEERFDAIVCDYYLGVGEMNGLELLEWLRASQSSIPFIMFTGRSREEVAIRALNLGADLYLKKDQEDLGTLFVELVHHIKSSVESVQMEKTLREERSRFQKYLDVAGVMIVALDSDGRITLMNRKGCEILGYDCKEIIGMDWFKTFIPKSPRKEVHRAFTRLMKGDIEPAEYFEIPILTKDGKERIMAWHNSVLTDESGNIAGTLSSGEDITERKRAEQAIQKSEEEFRCVFEESPIGIDVFDSDGLLIEANKACLDVFGVSSVDDIRGFSLFDDPNIPEEMKRRIRDGETIRYQAPFDFEKVKELGLYETSRSGIAHLNNVIAPFDRDEDGSFHGHIVQMQDVTERKTAEDALRSSQQLVKGTFDSLSEAVIVLDAETVEIVDCNPATETIFGYSRHELMGKNVNMLHVDEAALEEFRENLYPAIEEKGVLDRFEFRMKRRDGTVFPTEHSVTQLKNEQGTRVGWVIVVRDITRRKKDEDALRESEKRFRTVFKQAAVGVSIVEMDDNIIEANPFFQELIGYSADELVTMKVADFTHPDDTAMDASLTREVLDGKRDYFTMEKRYIRKTGEEIWGKLSANFVKDEEGIPEFCIGIVEDITERKLVEENLRQSEEKYRTIVRSISDIIFVHDKDDYYAQVYVSDEGLLTSSIEDFIGHHPSENVPPNLLQLYLEASAKVRDTGMSEGFEFPLTVRGKDKWFASSLTLHEDGESIISVTQDITERKLAEENLRQSEKKYRSLFDNTPVGLTFQEIVVDESGRPIDFVFIDVNEGFEALMGLRKDDIVGKSASHVLTSSGETELDWIDVYGKVALTGARARFDQYSEALGRWFSVTAYSPEKNSFITAYTDVTEQKRAYEDLKQQKKELSNFAHTMSHDLNTYFFKFRGLVHLLESKDEIPDIRRIQLLIAEMSNLVQHSVVLADAGLVIDKKHKVDLAHLVRDVAVRHLPEGIAIVQGPLLSVMADEIKLIQIFQNLFENAVEHGTPKTVEVQRYDSMDGVRIVVANDGKQIPNDSRSKVFQSGFTTKGKRRGFGLSIVKKLVEAHGWQIKLVDTPETAFEILIPSAAG